MECSIECSIEHSIESFGCRLFHSQRLQGLRVLIRQGRPRLRGQRGRGPGVVRPASPAALLAARPHGPDGTSRWAMTI